MAFLKLNYNFSFCVFYDQLSFEIKGTIFYGSFFTANDNYADLVNLFCHTNIFLQILILS